MGVKPARAELHSKIIDKEKEIVKGGRGETNGGGLGFCADL